MFTFAALPGPWSQICQLLLLIVAALCMAGFLFNRYDATRIGRLPKPLQLPQTFLLALVTVIVWLSGARDSAFGSLAGLIGAGMCCGFIGDLFLANVFKLRRTVEFGMAIFAIGHVCYMLAFREIALHYALVNLSLYALALAVTWLSALGLWVLLVRDPGGSPLQFVALGYALFLASMSGFALGLALQQPEFVPLAIGAILFLLSDTLIAARLFSGRSFPFMGDVIWLTYIVAQVLIVLVVPLVLLP